jgi:hypothetical protein
VTPTEQLTEKISFETAGKLWSAIKLLIGSKRRRASMLPLISERGLTLCPSYLHWGKE